MFIHNKRLQYTVRVGRPNPRLAGLITEQFGGADGELAAAMRYFTQGLAEEDMGRKALLMDIATEELSHLEIVGNLICMLNKGVKSRLAEGVEEGQLLAEITGGSESNMLSILAGSGPSLINSDGLPFSGAYVDSRGEPTVDLRSNIAAEARAKIVYERLLNMTDDSGVRDALTFLMTREVAHQKSFEKALYAIEGNFPVGKLPPDPAFANTYFAMSPDPEAVRGSWSQGPEWDFVGDPQPAVDGGDGDAAVTLDAADKKRLAAFAGRTESDITVDPTTGAELGQRQPEAGKTKQTARSRAKTVHN
ncbi:MAG: manganese catalase family protein [Clostridia bacterium]|nr:manganese catalase family protein [Deltaproteobacteria bacterium]